MHPARGEVTRVREHAERGWSDASHRQRRILAFYFTATTVRYFVQTVMQLHRVVGRRLILSASTRPRPAAQILDTV